MSNWTDTTLGAFTDIRVSNVDKKTVAGEREVHLCNYMDVYSTNSVTAERELMLASATESEFQRFRLLPGDVVITKDSESPDDIAVPTYISEGIGDDVVCGYHLAMLRPKHGLNGHFLSYLLRLPQVNRHFARTATGSTRYGLSLKALHEAPIRIPESEREQCGIAEVLSALDEQIEVTEALISKKVLVRSAILTALVEDAHASSVELDLLASKVGSGVTPTGGSEVYTSSGVTFVRSQNVLNESLELSDVAFITDEIHAGMAASKLQAHDVLLNITGASIGRSCTVPEGIGESNVNQHVCIIRLHHPCQADATLLAALICSEFGQRELNRQISGGNREGLNYQQVRAIALPWPQDAAIRAEMAAVLQSAKSEIEALEAEVMKSRQQKQGLMHDLLTGKTRVTTKLEALQ